MIEIKSEIEDLLNIKIVGGVTSEHVVAAIEVCEDILMMFDDSDVYETMMRLEEQLYR